MPISPFQLSRFFAKLTRMRTMAALLIVTGVGIPAVVSVDAARRRAHRDAEAPAIAAVCAKLPGGSLALSGGARWLRSPTTEEPAAAFADAPASLDADPAGGLLAPPRDIWQEQQTRTSKPSGSPP